MRAAALPGWVIQPGPGWHQIRVGYNGRRVVATDDLNVLLRALGPATPRRERVAQAAAPWLGLSGDGTALVVVEASAFTSGWRAGLTAFAADRHWTPTEDLHALPRVDALWLLAEAPEPYAALWCTAAAADCPIVWIPTAVPAANRGAS